MGSRHHYVSQFHLRGFTDPDAARPQEPWVWVANCATASIERRAPKNLAWSADLFAGAGGLADREASLEGFLATHVECPAASIFALFVRPEFEGRGHGGTLLMPSSSGYFRAISSSCGWPSAQTRGRIGST